MEKPRKLWLAVLLGTICPGCGQIYNGQAKRGVIIFLSILASILCFRLLLPALVGAKITPFNILIPVSFLALSLGIDIYSICGDVKEAWSKKSSYELKSYNKWYVYLLYYLIGYVFVIQVLVFDFRVNYYEPFIIRHEGMLPTLIAGDCLFTDKKIFRNNNPGRGDLVIFKFPPDPAQVFLQRVMAVGGDEVAIVDGDLLINRKTVKNEMIGNYTNIHQKYKCDSYKIYKETVGDNSYHILLCDRVRKGDNFGPVKVPIDSVFLMGDNRDNSADSRYWGFVPLKNVIGKPLTIYLSFDSLANKIRWKRIGLLLN